MIKNRKLFLSVMTIVGIGVLTGCQSKGDRAEEAKAVLREGTFPGAHPATRAPAPKPASASEARTLRPAAQPATPPPSPGMAPVQPSKPSSPLKRLGIEVQDGRIIIDPKRTRGFFEELERKLGGGASPASAPSPARDSSGKVIEVQEMGIHVGEDRIEIDLNRTRNVMKMWADSLKQIGEELEKALEPAGSGGY